MNESFARELTKALLDRYAAPWHVAATELQYKRVLDDAEKLVEERIKAMLYEAHDPEI